MQNFSSGLPSETKTQVGGLANNVAALLAYLPCIALLASILWLVTEPKSNRFLRFHALQSLFFGVALTVVFIILWIVIVIIQFVVASISTGLAAIAGLLFTLLLFGVGIAALGGYILCMMKAYQGQLWKLPVVGALAEKYSE
jgi:uncharacterized membrane protein